MCPEYLEIKESSRRVNFFAAKVPFACPISNGSTSKDAMHILQQLQ
jgi:hypothetical protein